ncbi:DUF4132 domain-containing protein [Anaerosporobacter sp.]|uniref:DUF4132 domain-containing protein n=1 Tax=Anaerosporobacter sp. TaxID=1872529 RepID=UPI00286EBC3E|nr:DUF4132 domain-containing protein [Anaerosporobacter sp.]
MNLFNPKTRSELWEKYKEEWKSKYALKDMDTQELIQEVGAFGELRYRKTPNMDKIISDMKRQEKLLPSEYMKKFAKRLVESLVPSEEREAFYYIIDKYNQFQYSQGIYRRSRRSKEYAPFLKRIFRLMNDYVQFSLYKTSLSAYLKNELSDELLDYKKNQTGYKSIECLSDMIAAHLDMGDQELAETVKEILFSENNTAIVTVELIQGIVKSSDRELHKILGDFLLAARLQEGVRQVVCENMDCGTTECFLTLFDVICEHNLIRYSSVKRAIATWTGLCDVSNMDRITEKIVALMQKSLRNREYSYELTSSNDSIEIMIGLWSLGFYEVSDAIAVMNEYLKSGTKNQKLTMSYFNSSLGYSKFSENVAKRVMEQEFTDLEMVAAFMPTYLSDMEECVQDIRVNPKRYDGRAESYNAISIYEFFESVEEAEQHFEIGKTILEAMPSKKIEYSPCIFPWYQISLSQSQIVKKICGLAYALAEEEKIDYAAGLLGNIDTSGTYAGRYRYMEMLLHAPKTPIQEDLLIQCVADKEGITRTIAFELVEGLDLKDRHYEQLEKMLRFKNAQIRQNVITLLTGRKGEKLVETVGRLLQGEKEEIRTGGLDVIVQLKKSKEREEELPALMKLATSLENPTHKEEILLQEICGDTAKKEECIEEGYGLYSPSEELNLPIKKADKNVFESYFKQDEKKLRSIFDKLVAFIEENKTRSYVASDGEECLLGNGLRCLSYNSDTSYEDCYPFKELWISFYEKEIGSIQLVYQMLLSIERGLTGLKNQAVYDKWNRKIFGKVLTAEGNNSIRAVYEGMNRTQRDTIETVLDIMKEIYDKPLEIREVARNIFCYIIEEFPEEALWYETVEKRYYSYWEEPAPFTSSGMMGIIRSQFGWKNDEEFSEHFSVLHQLNKRYHYKDKDKKFKSNGSQLQLFDYLKAYHMGFILKSNVYQVIFESIGLKKACRDFGLLFKEKLSVYEERNIARYKDCLTLELYPELIDAVLNVELRRGDMPTVFSEDIHSIPRIFGAKRFVEILLALGKDKLERNRCYEWQKDVGRTSCLSHLLKVCYPVESDSKEVVEKLLKGKGITSQRLVEVAMYAPQWMDLVEEYLEYSGFKSGCYYFIAHTDDYFAEREMAMISKYTPLTREELNVGAFDVTWFQEVYEMLGEKVFSLLYNGAKYISNGSKHARARKYADAALGKVTVEELEEKISDKRNKDLLMSYGLVPLSGKADILRRYEFLQKFLKESRQFGAGRRESEGAAVEMAMKNLATRAGYQDVMRLKLFMETEFVKAYESYFQWTTVEDSEIRIDVDEMGVPTLLCQKKGKLLKFIPAAIRKNEIVLGRKDLQKKLKDQYRRTVHMMEQAMEEQEAFAFEEVRSLLENPVVAPIIKKLVYVCKEEGSESAKGKSIGFLENAGLRDYAGKLHTLEDSASLYVAHPFDLYQAECWTEYQKCLFTANESGNRIKQPFKQVFRELYVKLPEEMEKRKSLLFAGNQIQPKKAVACLKDRHWIADYEDGLQKVYYKGDIVARIYCLADWFSPADVEAPTLEWVEFSHRKTFADLKIEEVPAIIYSEVMRDVDLAVSVAHVGGVDPETSHSTIEMRAAIVQFNLPLFGITNVRIEGSHALIEGTRGEYSIHLGSGMVHKIGAAQINVLPVHSQQRGKLFLPFVDEDPKTAEIMSKIVLFARDEKIKDPSILSQIVG